MAEQKKVKTLQVKYVVKMMAAMVTIGCIPAVIAAISNQAPERAIYQDNSTSGGWPIPPSA